MMGIIIQYWTKIFDPEAKLAGKYVLLSNININLTGSWNLGFRIYSISDSNSILHRMKFWELEGFQLDWLTLSGNIGEVGYYILL